MKGFTICFLIFVSLINPSSSARSQWVQTNGPLGGSVQCFASKGGELFAGTYDGGIFISLDSGLTWSTRNSGLTNWSVSVITSLGSTLFAGTDGGIFQSTNDGQSWHESNSGFPYYSLQINCLIVQGNKLFAGTRGGVYVSSNAGQNWSVVDTGLLSFSVADDRNVYSLASNGQDLYAATFGGLYLSSNEGMNWARIDTGLRAPQLAAVALYGTSIIVGTFGDGAYRSTDNGKSWKALGLPAVIDRLTVVHSMIYAAAGNYNSNVGAIFRSTDGGLSWAPIASHSRSYISAVGSLDDMTFAGADDGIDRSLDDGITWNPDDNGFSCQDISVFACDSTNTTSPTVYAAFFSRIYKTTDKGDHWTPLGIDSGMSSVQVMLASDSILIVLGEQVLGDVGFAAASRSSDGGKTWKSFEPLIGRSWVSAIGKIGNALIVCSDVTFRSADAGASWIALDSTHMRSAPIALVTIDSLIFASTKSGIYRSNDTGRTWTEFSSGLPSGYGGSLIVAEPDGYAPVLFVGIGSKVYGNPTRVYASSDLGENWFAADSGIAGQSITSFASSGSKVFASTLGSGVFVTTDLGKTWKSANSELLPPDVPQLLAANSQLYAGTRGGGVWRRAISEMKAVTTHAQSSIYPLLQNFPNPFNPTAAITYTLPERGLVTLEVFDMLGRRVALLAHETEEAGMHKFMFDGGGLGSGVYDAVLTVGGARREVRMVLER